MRTKAIMVLTLIFAVALEANTAEAQRIVTDGLISHWSFDRADTQGDIIKDAWGNNDGTIVGAPKVVEGKVGEALELNGVDQYVEVGHPADGSLDFGQDIDFTIAAWIKVSKTPADQYTIVGKGDRGDSPRILFKISGDLAYITLANEPGGGQKPDFTSNTPVVDGEWHYVALVADRRNATMIYIDGVLDAEGIGSDATDVNTESPLYIGKSHQDGNDPRRLLEGLIDEVSIYNLALSINEIEQNMVALGIAVKPASKKLAITWGKMKISD
jgi:sialidase-1